MYAGRGVCRVTLDSLQSVFDIFHNTTMDIIILGDYDDYENTYGSNKIIGTVTGDLQPYSGGLAEKEYGLTIECQYAFYCHTDSRIKEGVYLESGNDFYRVVYVAPWNMGLAVLLKGVDLSDRCKQDSQGDT